MANFELEEGEVKMAPRNPRGASYRPAYTVKKLEGTIERRILTKNAKTKKYETRKVQEPAGFMLYGMKRANDGQVNSIRVRTAEDLIRLGVSDLVPVLNNEGDEVGTIEL